jgi:hypothetical protein
MTLMTVQRFVFTLRPLSNELSSAQRQLSVQKTGQAGLKKKYIFVCFISKKSHNV